MSYVTKIKKLRRMSAIEMRCRLAKVLGRSRERKRWRRGAGGQRREQVAAAPRDWLTRFVTLVPGAEPDQLQRLRAEFPSYHQQLSERAAARAGKIRSGRWMLLGHDYDLTGNIPWHEDPRTGYQWPRRFYADLPLYNLPGETDVKYPWELSRHQFLCELARDFQLNESDESAQRIQELLADWIDQNPLYEGVNWTSGLEAAMRAISWTWTLASLASWDGWQEETLRKIAASLWDHGTYLADNFSYYSSPYNHLIGEATGLLLIATLFDESPTTRAWDQQARETLHGAAPAQFYQDHFCVEQAVGYHYYTLGFLTMAWSAARAGGRPLDELTPILRQAFLTGATFRRPDGLWPAIGDLDSARALPVFPDNDWSFDSLHQIAAALLDDARLKLPGDHPGEELYWLAGASGIERWHRLDAADSGSSRVGHVHRDSGYVVASDGRDWMLFDAGPIAGGLFADATPSTAHGHADMLQVLYHCAGESVLEDSGMPFYGGDQEWVNYFRSAAAHNTVQIEQADFVRHAGRLAWSHQVRRPELDAVLTDKYWLCRGHLQWLGVSHQRHVCCIAGQGLWVADLIQTDRPRLATWYWQLPPSATLSTRGASWDGMSVYHRADRGDGTCSLTTATAEGPEAWRCHQYGGRTAGKRLRFQHQVQDRLLVLTSIGRVERPRLSVTLKGLQVADMDYEPGAENQVIEQLGCRWSIATLVSV